jgi:serine/threonine-protein kinase RsbW
LAGDDPLVLTLDARLEETDRLAEAVRRLCATAGLSEDQAGELELAVVEAANNVVLHGYRERGGDQYAAELSQDDEGVVVTLVDRGYPVPADVLAITDMPPWDVESGRGMAIIKGSVDRFDYRSESGENRMVLRKRR